MAKIKNSHQAIQINHDKCTINLLSDFNEKFNYLLCYLGFFQVEMGPVSNIKRSLLRLAPLFQKSLLRDSCLGNNFSRSSFQTRVIPTLVLFSALSDHFFDFKPIFKCHTQMTERINWISRCRTLCRIFWKKIIKRSNTLRARQTLKILGVAICSHIIYFRFLSISGHLWVTQENQNWLNRSRRISCNWRKKFSSISKGKIFRAEKNPNWWAGVYSTILVITEIYTYFFFILLKFCYS